MLPRQRAADADGAGVADAVGAADAAAARQLHEPMFRPASVLGDLPFAYVGTLVILPEFLPTKFQLFVSSVNIINFESEKKND